VFLNGEAHTGAVRHRVLAGLDLGSKHYMADWSQAHALDSNNAFFDVNNPVYGAPVNGLPVFDRSKSLSQRAGATIIDQAYTGLYLQDELGFFDDALRVTIAGRYTYVKENSYGTKVDDNRFTPRFGLSYSVDKSASVYALYDQTFVPQTGLLRNQQKAKPILGNNLEAGVKKDWFGGKWNTTLSVYRIIKNNELTPDPTNEGNEAFSVQLGQSKAEGVEFDIRGEVFNGLSVVANYAFTNSVITRNLDKNPLPGTEEGAAIPGFAKHTANAWLQYKLTQGALKGFGISGGFTYLADRSTWSWGGIGQQQMPDYFKLDGGLFWQKDKVSINANVFNILDTYLYSGSSYETYYYWQAEPGRNMRVSIGYKF
jgi:iron complex outermembrane receptor protein